MSVRALVVDDSLTVRMDLLEALTAAGIEGVGAASLAHARKALAAAPFDIAILDVRLGDGDGVDLLREIRASSRMPVIMLSSEAEVRDRVRGLEHGADDYAGKPYALSWVVARVRELTRTSQLAHDRPTVLVIDDSVSFREAIREALEDASYRAVTAASGEDGLREAAAIRPALVICDGELPGIDGATVIRRLRLDAALRHTPCIMISGSYAAGREIGAFEAGVDAFLGKDTPPAEIVARIAALLAASQDRPVSAIGTALGAHKVLVVGRGLEPLSEVLRGDAFDVATAGSTDDALLLLRHERPVCVLVEVTAASTCELLRGRMSGSSALVALTPEHDSALAVECISVGVDEVVSRLTPAPLVVARIRAQIRRKQAEEEAARERDSRTEKALVSVRTEHLAQLEKMNEELAVANTELEAFSYTVSHDLRAPLRAIEGFTRALVEDEGHLLQETGRAHVDRVLGATKRMGELIEDLLSLSRLGRSDLVRTQVDLSALATEIVGELRARDPDRVVDVRIEPGLVAEGDRGLLRAVLENLVGNAWKFTSKREHASIAIGALAGADPAFFVKDDGAGFDMGMADNLFRPFKRLHGSRDFEGTGIGLATVRRIVVRHGGHVWAESLPGAGATFYFTLR